MVAGRSCGLWESGRMYKIWGAKGHFVCLVSFAGSAWQILMQTSAARSRLKTWTCGGQRLSWNKPSIYEQAPLRPSYFFNYLPLPICWQKFGQWCPPRDCLGWRVAAGQRPRSSVTPKTCRAPGNGQDSLEQRAAVPREQGLVAGAARTRTSAIQPRCLLFHLRIGAHGSWE